MTRHRLLGLALLGVAGCVIYPSVEEAGGARIRPENGRLLRPAPAGGTAVVYVDVINSGAFPDTLVGVLSDTAGRAELRQGDAPIRSLEIPPASRVMLASEARYIRLSDLRRDLRSGDQIIVTLIFAKSGAIGVITVVP